MTQRRWLDGEAFLPLLGLDNLDGDGGSRADAVSSVGTVGKAVGQEWPEPARGAQQRDAAMAVVQLGWRDSGDQQATLRIGQRVASSS